MGDHARASRAAATMWFMGNCTVRTWSSIACNRSSFHDSWCGVCGAFSQARQIIMNRDRKGGGHAQTDCFFVSVFAPQRWRLMCLFLEQALIYISPFESHDADFASRPPIIS